MTTRKRIRSKSPKTARTFVIDTSVLLYSGESIFSFGKERVAIPLSVLDELDTFKTRQDEVGRNARFVIRALRELGKAGQLSTGVKLESGGILTVYTYADEHVPAEVTNDVTDNRILGLCKFLQQGSVPEVTLITKDVALAVKSQVIGIPSEDYFEEGLRNRDEAFSGVTTEVVSDSTIKSLYSSGACQTELHLFPNQFVLAVNEINEKNTCLTRFTAEGALVKVTPSEVWGLKPRNLEQIFAVDLLNNDKISLVSLSGVAGSGKTILAVGAGLQKVVEEQKYNSLIITRPTISVGEEMGFLPGNIDEKYEPWIRPIRDAVSVLFGSKNGRGEDRFDEFIHQGIIRIEPMAYIRGRTFHNNYMILDEAQNLTRHQMKTFLTRVGENTKVVMTGDTHQIDCPSLDSASNGLSQVVEKFKTLDLAGHVFLDKGERSTLATVAAKVL